VPAMWVQCFSIVPPSWLLLTALTTNKTMQYEYVVYVRKTAKRCRRTLWFTLQWREDRFRTTSESTNQRVLWWAVAQTFLLVIVGFWQMRHLRSFFEAKKLVWRCLLVVMWLVNCRVHAQSDWCTLFVYMTYSLVVCLRSDCVISIIA